LANGWIVSAKKAFRPSLVIAEMLDCSWSCIGSLLQREERLRRLFFGLDVDCPWDETLLLIRGIWASLGIEKDRLESLEDDHEEYVHDKVWEVLLIDLEQAQEILLCKSVFFWRLNGIWFISALCEYNVLSSWGFYTSL
jgi:hypothetical protein